MGRKHKKFSDKDVQDCGLSTAPNTDSLSEEQPGSSCSHTLLLLVVPAQTVSRVIPEKWGGGVVVGVCSLMVMISWLGAWHGSPVASVCWAGTSACGTTSPS